MAYFAERLKESQEPNFHLRAALHPIEDINRVLKGIDLSVARLRDAALLRADDQLALLQGQVDQAFAAYSRLEGNNRQNEVAVNFDEKHTLTKKVLLQLQASLVKARLLRGFAENLGTLQLDEADVAQLRGSFRRPMLVIRDTVPEQVAYQGSSPILDLTANPPELFEQEPLVIAESAAPAEEGNHLVAWLENPPAGDVSETVPVVGPVVESPAIAQVLGALEAAMFEPLPERQQALDIDAPVPEPARDITRMPVVLFDDQQPMPAPRFGNGPARHNLPSRPRPEDMARAAAQVVRLAREPSPRYPATVQARSSGFLSRMGIGRKR